MLIVGEWQENCFLLVDKATNQSILIDPGDEAERILAWVEATRVREILITHAHLDHIGAVEAVRSRLGLRAGLHPADTELALIRGLSADFALYDGDLIRLGAHEIRVSHTPGHTPGSICLLFDTRAVVGDVIFTGGPGHTNSPEELGEALQSLRRSVFTWPDETELFPGHGSSTRVGRERPGFEAFMARPLPPDLYGDITW